jgi:hypothetical protein
MPSTLESDPTDSRDLDLIARAVGLVVLQWGQAEQSLELLVASLWQSFSGKRFAKKIPVLLKPKIAFVRDCFAGTPALKPMEPKVTTLLRTFENLSELRHDLIHGAPASIATVDGNFVFLRLEVRDGFHHTREVRVPVSAYPELVSRLVALGKEAHQVADEVFQKSKFLDLTPSRPK